MYILAFAEISLRMTKRLVNQKIISAMPHLIARGLACIQTRPFIFGDFCHIKNRRFFKRAPKGNLYSIERNTQSEFSDTENRRISVKFYQIAI